MSQASRVNCVLEPPWNVLYHCTTRTRTFSVAVQQYHPAPVTWSTVTKSIVDCSPIDRVGRTPGLRAASGRRRYQIVFITASIAIAYKKEDVECVHYIYFLFVLHLSFRKHGRIQATNRCPTKGVCLPNFLIGGQLTCSSHFCVFRRALLQCK